MGLDAAFRAAHRRCGLSDVHVFPVTHEEGFALTCRQFFYFLVNDCKDLRLQQLALGRCAVFDSSSTKGFQRV